MGRTLRDIVRESEAPKVVAPERHYFRWLGSWPVRLLLAIAVFPAFIRFVIVNATASHWPVEVVLPAYALTQIVLGSAWVLHGRAQAAGWWKVPFRFWIGVPLLILVCDLVITVAWAVLDSSKGGHFL